jgi:hypothetical protein
MEDWGLNADGWRKLLAAVLAIHPACSAFRFCRSVLIRRAAITRTALSSPIQSSGHSGKSVLCPRSTPSTKRFIRSPQTARRIIAK